MRHSTDLTDSQWKIIEPFFTREKRGKHFQKHSKRELVNAVLYLNKTGCQWRLLPKDFPLNMSLKLNTPGRPSCTPAAAKLNSCDG
jgi:transposase